MECATLGEFLPCNNWRITLYVQEYILSQPSARVPTRVAVRAPIPLSGLAPNNPHERPVDGYLLRVPIHPLLTHRTARTFMDGAPKNELARYAWKAPPLPPPYLGGG